MNAGISRLTTILAIVAAVLIARAATPAHAGSPIAYADGDSGRDCASLTPCYLTIQDAVNHVGGPTDASVKVFPGTYNESVNLNNMASAFNHVLGNLTLSTVDAAGDPSPGTATVHGSAAISTSTQGFPNDVALDGFIVQSTQKDGVFINTSGAITIRNLSVDNPGDDGFDLATTDGGAVTIENSKAEHAHAALADGIQIVTTGGATISNTEASHNKGLQDNAGINMPDSQGNIVFSNVTANDNTEQGITVYTTGTITLSGQANDNGFRGADFFTEFGTPNSLGDPQPQQGGAGITIDGFTADNNAGDGLLAQAFPDIVVRNTQADGNGERGMNLLGQEHVEVTNAHVEDNHDLGIYIEAITGVAIDRVSAIGNGGGLKVIGFGSALAGVSVRDSLVQDNMGQGIDLFNLAAGGVHNISSDVICGNTLGGLRNNGTSLTVPAEGNWWGNGNGPTSSQNPGGQGDNVNAGGDGTIDFTPWITHVEVTQLAGPAGSTGVASTLVFEFPDDADTAFLNNGPGDDLIRSPLTVATDNGTITIGGTTAAGVEGFIENTQLQATLSPTHGGQATVTLSGPCNLTTQLVLDIGSGLLRGDLDCNGSIGALDLIRSLRFTAGVTLDTISGCVSALGNFDLDCGGTANGVDPLLLVLYLASLPPLANLPGNCPHVGT